MNGVLVKCQTIQNNRVCTGHGKLGKSWNFRISFSRPGKSWKMMFIKKYKINGKNIPKMKDEKSWKVMEFQKLKRV